MGAAGGHRLMALHEISADLKTAESTLTLWEREYPKLARAEATASVYFETAWADAIQLVDAKEIPAGGKKPTVGVMEAEATTICQAALKAKRFAAAELDIAKKLIGIAETTLTSIQTRVKLEQIEAALNGYRV